MKLLFNCTTNNVGGGVKNSAMFIKYALQDKINTYFFAISPQVKDILDKWNIQINNSYLFEKSPAKNQNIRKQLIKLANELDIDLVFTMAGPAYVKFKQIHVLGISNPYITHTDFQGLTIGKNIKYIFITSLLLLYQAFYSRKADFWIFQTKESRNGYIKRYFVSKNNTFVVSNSIGTEFLDYYKDKPIVLPNKNTTINIFCPAAGYLHKGLHLIPLIAKELNFIAKETYNFKFILTIDKKSDLWLNIYEKSKKYLIEDKIENIGPYNYTTVMHYFDSANIVFVPSILETFTASYLEAFASKRLLFVADKKFAKDICQDAAVYIDPFDAIATAEKINFVINNPNSQKEKIEKGVEILKLYGTQKERFEKIISYLNQKGENNV